jgi:hypothetical protein
MARSAAGAALAFATATQAQRGADGHRLEAREAAFDFSWVYPSVACRSLPRMPCIVVSFASHALRSKERAR